MTTPAWESLAVRGLVSLVFGTVALARPGIALALLTLAFGAYAFADGLVALVSAMGHRARGLLLLDGVLGIAAGIVTLFWPGITLIGLLLVIGVRFLLSGIVEVIAAVRLRHVVDSPVLFGLGGVASIALGVLMFVAPGISSLVLVVMLGAYALAFGALMVGFAFRIRHATRRVPLLA